MWIRSQNKKVLCKCEEVYLGDHYDYYQIETDKWLLGEYSTEEKALKVLDVIQTHLEHLEYKVSGREVIFQMPQDDEVLDNA